MLSTEKPEAPVTITPKPITTDTFHIDDRSPIGTRYTHGRGFCTLVAYEMSPTQPQRALPMFVDDYDLDTPRTEFDILSDGSIPLDYATEFVDDNDPLTVAPDDLEKSQRARAAAQKRYNEPPADTGDLHRILCFEDLDSDEEIQAFHRWGATELELRKVQYDLARASRARADALQVLVHLRGSQDRAGKTVGLNQSSVSRALRSATPDQP